MQPVKSCLHCQFLCHVLKALIFIKIFVKFSYFCKKMQLFLCWGLRLQTPRPQKAPLNAILWLRLWCFYYCYVILFKLILWLAGVYGFRQAALSLNKFAHSCSALKGLIKAIRNDKLHPKLCSNIKF